MLIKSSFNIADLSPDWWFDLSRTDALGINQPGNEVINITTIGGAGTFTQSGSGLRGELITGPNNRKVVLMDGSQDQRYVGTGIISNPSADFELNVVANSLSSSITRTIFSQQDGTGTGRAILSVTNSGLLTSFLGGANSSGITNLHDGKFHVLSYRFNDGTNLLRLYVDGGLENSFTRNIEAASGSWIMGANKNQNSNFYDGEIAEGFFLNGESEDPTFFAYQKHLCAKWGIEYKGP